MSAGKSKARSHELVLRLYVAGQAPNSTSAVASLRSLLSEHPDVSARLEVVDLLEQPERGISDGVIVTPTLLKAAPSPERRMIGDLRDRAALLAVLGLMDGAP